MRGTLFFVAALVLAGCVAGCDRSAKDAARIQEMKVYLLKVVDSQKRYKEANQTYSLNMKELMDFDSELGPPPAGYNVKGGGRLSLAFGYEVEATPEGEGPNLYVNGSGIVRYSYWGAAGPTSNAVD
jgi:hypothetical protein